MTHTGFYAGSFDPVTNGHMDIIGRACRMVDKLVVGVGVHPGKAPLFPAEKRIALLKEVCASVVKETETIIEVRSFADLTIAAAQQAGATLLIRGVRDGSDCDYEMQLAGMNGAMAPQITTVFLPSSPSARHITATLVRQIAGMGGDVTPFVPPAIAAALSEAFAPR